MSLDHVDLQIAWCSLSLSVEEIINGFWSMCASGKWETGNLGIIESRNTNPLMKLSISVYCILLYYQKVFNYNGQNLLNTLLDRICRMPNRFAGWGGDARLDNWKDNQHNVFWKGKKKLCHMFPCALILCEMGCFAFNTVKMPFHLQFRVCFIYLTQSQMHSTDPSWKTWPGSGPFLFPWRQIKTASSSPKLL